MSAGYPGRERIVFQPVDDGDLFEARVQGFDEVQGDVSSPFGFVEAERAGPRDDAQLYRIEVMTDRNDAPSPHVARISAEEGRDRRGRLYRIHFDTERTPPGIKFVTMEPADVGETQPLYRVEWDEENA
jgi:hypothetical protein